MNKMKVFKVCPGEGLCSRIEKDPSACLTWLEESEPGEIIKIEVLEMTEAEYEDQHQVELDEFIKNLQKISD